MDKIYIGKITGFHGIKGELKIISDFEKKDICLKKDFVIYIDKEEFKITSSKIHKNNYLITINNLYDLNLVNKYIGSSVFINKDDLKLKNGEYLVNDLINFEVYDNETYLGKVSKIMYNKNNKFLYIENEKAFYIPLIDVYIKEVDLENKKIYTVNGKDLII